MRRLLFLAVLICGPAHAASLRNVTTLHGPMVFVRDLFDNAGPSADRVLGPGPAPGDSITVGAQQLDAIARQFNIPWRSISLADQARLEWPGRPLRREEAVEAVRVAVTAAGASEDSDIDIPGFSGPTVPTETQIGLAVSQLDFDGNTGRFTAALTINGEAMNAISMRLSGRVEEMITAPVAAARLLPETVLRVEDVRMARVRASLVSGEIARSPEQIVGMQIRRPIPSGQVLRLSDLTRPPLVQRGALVQIQLEAAGIKVNGQATAMEDGADGELIHVQNGNSRAFLVAKVVGPGKVVVDPNAPPAFATTPTRFERRR